jgi:hypothetical protein
MRFSMTFNEFKSEYMENLEGYLPTYIGANEEFNDKGFILLNIEMIFPLRMMDGPSRFFRVISVIVNKDQYGQMIEYVKNAGERWKSDLLDNITKAPDYSISKFEENEND